MKHPMRFSVYIFCCLLLFACSDAEGPEPNPLRPVVSQLVGKSSTEQLRSFSGVAKAGDEIELSFRSSGVLTELNIKAGQEVKKGDLIGKLDNVEANLAYEQSVSAMNAAKSNFNTAKSNLDRIRSLYEKGTNSLSDYEAAKNSYQAALDQFESAKRNQSIQREQVNYGYIYASKSGIIARTDVEVNENINAGQRVAVLNAGTDINVMVGLPEKVINNVVLEMPVEIHFTSINEKYAGRVIEISPVVDQSSSTYPVKIELTSPNDRIKPGMAANVTFDFKKKEKDNDQSIVVPIKAVGEDGAGNFVFIVESREDGTGLVRKQKVEIGDMTSDGFTIVRGLTGGEAIAVAGLQTLVDGQAVSLSSN